MTIASRLDRIARKIHALREFYAARDACNARGSAANWLRACEALEIVKSACTKREGLI